MAVIFYLSSLPKPALPPGFGDKPSHSRGYMGLAVAIVRALAGGLPRRLDMRVAVAGVLLTIAYAVTDEIHQSFVPGRSADVYDTYADAVGAFAGTAACWAWGIISHGPGPRASRHGL
jgi:VanZ family protein